VRPSFGLHVAEATVGSFCGCGLARQNQMRYIIIIIIRKFIRRSNMARVITEAPVYRVSQNANPTSIYSEVIHGDMNISQQISNCIYQQCWAIYQIVQQQISKWRLFWFTNFANSNFTSWREGILRAYRGLMGHNRKNRERTVDRDIITTGNYL